MTTPHTLACICGGTPALSVEREPYLGTDVAAQIACPACGRSTPWLPTPTAGDLSPTMRAWAAVQGGAGAGAKAPPEADDRKRLAEENHRLRCERASLMQVARAANDWLNTGGQCMTTKGELATALRGCGIHSEDENHGIR